MRLSILVTGGLLIFQPVACAVLAIDYGTEWTKASLVKPGIPLEIVLTKDTKRKEQSVIAFKGTERLYGGDAANLAARLPAATFLSMKTLLGREFDSAEAKHFSVLYPSNKMIRTSRNSIAFEFEKQVFTVEELIAMQFINMRRNAELMADEAIRDVVMTVPPYFGQKQRQALLDTTRLAGLNCLEMLNDGLAVALDYAKGRTFNTSQTHVIFDMGAGSTSATVVKFDTQTVKDFGRFNKTVTNIVVLGSSYQTTASGNTMTERLYNHLQEQFDATLPASVTSRIASNSRGLARLYKEATRVKQVLSANSEAVAAVESLHEGIDFRYKITRTQFEELNTDLAKLSTEPVVQALRSSGLHAADIDSLILHGGAARAPFVQKALLEVIDEFKIARNVNADEAAVMGAVFRGAALSGSFRVKEIVLQDLSSFSYLQTTAVGSRSLYTSTSYLNTRLNLTLPRSATDFRIEFSETGSDETATEFLQLKIQGVANATNSLAALGCVAPEVVITTLLDSSMIFSVPEASITCDIEERQGVADRVKGWFAKESTTSTTISSKVAKPSVVSEAGPQIVRKKESLSLISVPAGLLQNIRAEERIESLKKIKVLEQFDQERLALETARNGLEAFVYRIRDYLDSDGFQEVSTAEERENVRSGAAIANDWLYNEGESAGLEDFVSQQKILRDSTDPILLRREELQKRDAKIAALEKQIDASRSFIKSQFELIRDYNEQKAAFDDSVKNAASKPALVEATAAESSVMSASESESPEDKTEGDVLAEEQPSEDNAPTAPSPPVYAERDIKTMEIKLDEIEEWFVDRKRQQQKLSKTDDPVLLSADVDTRLEQLTQDFMAILMKASYKPKPKVNPPKKSRTSVKGSAKTSTTITPDSRTSIEDEDASVTPLADVVRDVPDAQVAEGVPEADAKVDPIEEVAFEPAMPTPGVGVRDEL